MTTLNETYDDLNKLSKKDLVKKCISKGLPKSGTINKLINRLLNPLFNKKHISEFSSTPSKEHTKAWRKSQSWYVSNCKSSRCEKLQRATIEHITKKNCPKSDNLRLNKRTLELQRNCNPLTSIDGYDLTEDFDGHQVHDDLEYLYNFKMVCDKGGSQTRTLRDETYDFVETQLKYIAKNPDTKYVFINILDGDESYKNKDKFTKHLFKYYPDQKNKCLVLDTNEFKNWYEANS